MTQEATVDVSRILQREIEADLQDSGLAYCRATIADRLETVDRNLALLTTDEARGTMLQALVSLWTPPAPGRAALVGYPKYGSPEYNAIEIVVIAIRDLLSEW